MSSKRATWRGRLRSAQAARAASQRPTLFRHLTDDPPPEAPLVGQSPIAAAREALQVCDRSGDVGSKHYWPEGAVVGDWCRCGKRRKFPPCPESF